ncbi:hypothetical protein TNCV_4041851 [Trichonephila clavipes]|nr:hypothetical protein TNCV_4041851 [Trichonephila clavipes]
MTAQGYVHDILQPHSYNGSQDPFFNKTMLGLTRQRVSQDCLRTVTTLPLTTRFVSNPAYLGSFETARHHLRHLGIPRV